MTVSIPKQAISGQLQISSLAGTIRIPRQGLSGTIFNDVPTLLNVTIRLPMFGIAGILDNPPSIAGEIAVPMQAVAASLHYFYVVRKRYSCSWWLTESAVLSHTAPADIGIFARRRLGSRWWLTYPVASSHRALHDIGLWVHCGIKSRYAIRVGREQVAGWRLPVEKSHVSPYGCRAERLFGAGYAISWPVQVRFASAFALRDTNPVRARRAAEYGLRVAATLRTEWGRPFSVRQSLAAPYTALRLTAREHRAGFALGLGDPVIMAFVAGWNLKLAAAHRTDYQSCSSVTASLRASHDLPPPIVAGLAAWWALTARSRLAHRAQHDLVLTNRAVASLSSPFGGTDFAPRIEAAAIPVLRLGARRIELFGASIGVDEPSPWWTARLEIAELADFSRINVGDAATLEIGNAAFALVIDGKRRVRNAPSALRLEVTARSPLAALAPPMGPSISRNFSEVVEAEDAVRELLPGVALDWQLPGWWIPAGRLVAADANRVDIARNIARAAGGILESLPDGRVTARPLYPVSLPDYGAESVLLVFTDDDLFEAEETLDVRTGMNLVRIGDGDQSQLSDRVEFIRDDNDVRQGIVRAAPSPWRTLGLAHTGDASVSIVPLGERLQEAVELVEFKAGTARLGWPIEDVRAVRWQYRDLGVVTFTRGASEISAGGAEGYSMAEIRYGLKVFEWQVANLRDETIQFLVLEA